MHHYSMTLFWDRENELAKIQRLIGKSGFGYIMGRRRVGKTALLLEACKHLKGVYHQAVEGTPQQQLTHLTEEIKQHLPIFRDVIPKNWSEFFGLLSKEKLPKLVVFDEFPYWVEGDATLPSFLQKWIDHELPKQKCLVLTSGSSQSMLFSQFLNHASPLYGRASLHIHLNPLSYRWFCKALNYSPDNPRSFERFCLVGGVPHYWKLMPKGSLIGQAEALYFEPSAILAEEPIHMLRDEGMTGTLPKAILDLIGRGVSKPAEIASRLGTAQGNLSRPLALLLALGFIHRELPYGESSRTTKKVLYSIQDPALAFYYRIYLPFRSRWHQLTPREKGEMIHDFASLQWENFCRLLYPQSSRYWEKDVEIDLVAPLGGGKTLVAECKWKTISIAEKRHLLENLRQRFDKTKLRQKVKQVELRIFSQKDLRELSQIQASLPNL